MGLYAWLLDDGVCTNPALIALMLLALRVTRIFPVCMDKAPGFPSYGIRDH